MVAKEGISFCTHTYSSCFLVIHSYSKRNVISGAYKVGAVNSACIAYARPSICRTRLPTRFGIQRIGYTHHLLCARNGVGCTACWVGFRFNEVRASAPIYAGKRAALHCSTTNGKRKQAIDIGACRVGFYIHCYSSTAALKNTYLRANTGVDNEVVIGIAQHTLVGKTTGRLGIGLLCKEYSGCE